MNNILVIFDFCFFLQIFHHLPRAHCPRYQKCNTALTIVRLCWANYTHLGSFTTNVVPVIIVVFFITSHHTPVFIRYMGTWIFINTNMRGFCVQCACVFTDYYCSCNRIVQKSQQRNCRRYWLLILVIMFIFDMPWQSTSKRIRNALRPSTMTMSKSN